MNHKNITENLLIGIFIQPYNVLFKKINIEPSYQKDLKNLIYSCKNHQYLFCGLPYKR